MFYFGRQFQGEDLNVIAAEHRSKAIELLKTTLFVQFICPQLIVFGFWNILNQHFLLAWSAFYFCSTSFMAYFLYTWYPNSENPERHKILDLTVLSWAAIVSLVLFIPLFLFSPNQYPEETIFFYIVTFGYLACALGAGGYWPGFYFIYACISLLCFVLHVLFSYQEANYFLAFGATIFSPLLIHISLTFNRQSAENIILKKRHAELAKENAQQKKQAENMANSRQLLLAASSHDLRQPLQAMNLFLSSIEESRKPEDASLLQRLKDSVNGMNELLEGMLDLSKLESDSLPPHMKTIYLPDFLEKIEQQFKHAAEKKNLALSANSCESYILSDSVLLERLLSNLISNAIKYTESGEINVEATALDKGQINITVSDTGIGVSEAEQTNIFEEFIQLNNPERDRQKGLGLGLSIVKRLCTLMQIPLEFKSQAGQGTCVSIKLPQADKPENSLQPSDSNHIELSANTNLHNKTALVIDDNKDIRDALDDLLSRWSMKVISVESAHQACEQLQQQALRPDIIISDYRLRENKTGIEAIEDILALYQDNDIPAFLLSGDIAAQHLSHVKEQGYQLLHKPIKAPQLRSILQRALSD